MAATGFADGMLIRRETKEDAAAIRAVHQGAFALGDTGSRSGDLAAAVLPAEAVLVDRLRADGDVLPGLSLVAEVERRVVGHVVISRATLGSAPSAGLGPLGVMPDRQRRGVGTALMHAVLGAAEALDLPEVVLLGDPRFYARFGFRAATELGVLPPDVRWGEHFQVRPLTSGRAGRAGAFAYAPAFDLV